MQSERYEVKLNLEYDFKRKPVIGSARMVEVSGTGVSHLSFDTAPWGCVEDALMTRVIFDKWRETHCLKTLADMADWENFRMIHVANQRRAQAAAAEGNGGPDSTATRGVTGRVNMTQTGPLGIVKRVFLAAYVKRGWGLAEVDLSQSRLANWLSAAGYATKLSAVKNGTGARLDESVVPPTDEVMAFLNVVKARFPGLEMERFLIKEE